MQLSRERRASGAVLLLKCQGHPTVGLATVPGSPTSGFECRPHVVVFVYLKAADDQSARCRGESSDRSGLALKQRSRQVGWQS